MQTKELKQMVKLDHDSEKMVEQSASFDGKWINLVHDGHEIPLSLENWEKLKELAEKVIN